MHVSESPQPLESRRSGPLAGITAIPGDKSISHRALILGSLAVGETHISGLLEAEDVLNTAEAMRRLGAQVTRDGGGAWRVRGVGVGAFAEPADVLDFGNSGTGSRLVMGAVATTPIKVVFTGDDSLRRRPMQRVLDPLALFGAEFTAGDGGVMPITIVGAKEPLPVDCEIKVASAQVKSAVLLAALTAPGRSRIVQRVLTRDHTERMLKAFGVQIEVTPLADNGGISARRGLERSGVAHFDPRRIAQSAPHRADRDAFGNGRRHQDRKCARNWWRKNRRSCCAKFVTQRRSRACRARAVDDRRISDPGRRRCLRRGANGDAWS
jgi:3-phosphoshikimate 1-carboxyvinyltransferase